MGMKNKGSYIIKFIMLFFIILPLFYFFIKTIYFSYKITILPFLICGLIELVKVILLLLNKTKFIPLLNKFYIIIFLVYWFGFLGYWGYISLIDGQYLLLLFSTPFWIVGIYVIYQSFFQKAKKLIKKTKKPIRRITKYPIKIIISGFLVGLCFLSGIIMLFLGITDTYKLNEISKSYTSTNGYFSHYDIYSSDKDGTTYSLTYIYQVDGVEYTIQTDYGTNYVPNPGHIREVKYNPDNPQESILVGTNRSNGFLYIGAFFTLVSFTFILLALATLGYFDKFKIDIIGTYLGILFTIIGIGILLFQNGTTGSLIETISSFGLWILIPFMFIIIGIFLIIKTLFLKNRIK